MENKVSIEIPPADLQAVKDALQIVGNILNPYLIALTDDERRTMLKMGEATEPFVGKVMDYVVSNPQFLNPFTDVPEMQKDWKAISQLLPVFRTMDQICSNLNDTLMEAGKEVLEPALAYYNAVKMGVRMNVPDAKPIYEELRKRWEKRRKPNQEEA
ncbi:hypothetical protein D0X99_13905 [Algoriphagus lacus]|uniref:Uncharacterized protein n=1 Tax=Algoriphagus lacus TaxID=2056311 RepID=A0A418PQN4_9BACT|nr:hypothetical protein [Algoriphagus lacus]RIW14629.1 hypothetical protein D0X99_13905 [Algoriphagus lacus]